MSFTGEWPARRGFILRRPFTRCGLAGWAFTSSSGYFCSRCFF